MTVLDVTAQLADYRGAFIWNSYVDGQGTAHPTTRVNLYIKSHPLPVRKPKFTETVGVDQIDNVNSQATNFKGVFFSQPDPLSVQIQGYIVSPVNSSTHRWAITDVSGVLLSVGNVNYADLVSMYLSGRLDPSGMGAPRRRDPDIYITPYGHQYLNPVVAVWEPTLTPNMKKQQFSATLYLER